jgi:hypothetical protein
VIRFLLTFSEEHNPSPRDVETILSMLKEAADDRTYRDICMSHGITITDMRRKGDVNAAFLAKARSRVR